MNGLQHMASSLFITSLLSRLRSYFWIIRYRTSARRVDVELPTSYSDKARLDAEEETASVREYNDHAALIFTLNLCFFLAGLAQFISLTTFRNQASWNTGCAFVVAWGGMSSQLARLLGLTILTIELSRIGIKRWELSTLCTLAFVGLVFVFATNATNNGITKLAQSAGTAFCYRKRYLPTTLTSSTIRLVIEVYLVARLVALSRSQRRWLSDCTVKTVVIVRACSLLLLDLLTVVPDSITTNIVADFLPFSIGALIVLAAFNWKATTLHPSGRSNVQSLLYVSKATADPLLAPTPFTLHLPRQYRRSTHSWCSQSAHPAPSTVHSALDGAGSSSVLDAAEFSRPVSTETAIISVATAAQRRSVKQIMLPVPQPHLLHPQSAPPQFPAFATLPGRILQSQVALAAQLEAEAAASSPVPTPGPAVPRLEGLPNSASVLSDEDGSDPTAGHSSPSSAVYGSDILQTTPSRRRADGAPQPSPAPTQTSFALSPAASRRSTYRRSYGSTTTSGGSPSSAEWDTEPRSALSRSASRRHARAPDAASPSSAKHSWRRRPSLRARSASASGVDTELAPVREGSPDPAAAWPPSPASSAGIKSRRGTFGHSAQYSRRATASLGSLFRSAPASPLPPLPVPAVPPVLSAVLSAPGAPGPTQRRTLPALSVLVPEARVSAASPSAQVILPSAPAQLILETRPPSRPGSGSGFARPVSAGSLKGPRPLPSALLSGGALRERRDAELRAESAERHNRSNSAPSANVQVNFAGLEAVTRSGTQ